VVVLVETIQVTLFFIGVGFGAVATKTDFCVQGAFSDYFIGGVTTRLKAIIAAIIVFFIGFQTYSAIYGYDICSVCADVGWGEFPGLHNFLGGVIQGFGYILAAGCPLSILRRAGSGSGSHIIAVFAVITGFVIYTFFMQDIFNALSPFIYSRANYIFELF
jgi:hypothetical protein